jgi:hypothetical protein
LLPLAAANRGLIRDRSGAYPLAQAQAPLWLFATEANLTNIMSSVDQLSISIAKFLGVTSNWPSTHNVPPAADAFTVYACR